MTTYRPKDGFETYEQPTDATQTHRVAPVIDAGADPAAAPIYARDPDPDDGDGEARQRQKFGGLNWGAAFFGWLVSVAVVALLSAVVAAGVAALGKTGDVLPVHPSGDARTVTLTAAGILFGLLIFGYYIGGYVAGRMSRFDGGKQGVGVWISGLLLTGVGVGAALLLGHDLSGLLGMNLPTLALPAGASGIRGVITAVAALISSLLAATAGGKVGCRYHRKVDDAAYL